MIKVEIHIGLVIAVFAYPAQAKELFTADRLASVVSEARAVIAKVDHEPMQLVVPVVIAWDRVNVRGVVAVRNVEFLAVVGGSLLALRCRL